METHTCPECHFSSNWAYNVSRHFMRKHVDINTPIQQNSIPIQQICNPIQQICNPNKQICNLHVLHENQCEKCEKILSSKQNFNNHIKKCIGKINILECKICKEVFTLHQAKYRHQKKCNIKAEEEAKEKEKIMAQTIYNINNNNINNSTNTTNSHNININLLTFPKEGENNENFKFLSDHIDAKEFRRIWDQQKPEIGFRKFMHALLNRAENRIVHKTNLNTKHSEIHIGDNKWETALDRNVYPTLMHEVSCTALEHSQEYKKKKLTLSKISIEKILKYLDIINKESDDMGNRFTDAMDNIEVIVYNITKNWKAEIDKIDKEKEDA